MEKIHSIVRSAPRGDTLLRSLSIEFFNLSMHQFKSIPFDSFVGKFFVQFAPIESLILDVYTSGCTSSNKNVASIERRISSV